MDFETFKQFFVGHYILPTDPDYDNIRNTYMGEGKPALIVQPLDAEDTVTAVTYARDNNLTLSVRSGGHSGAGFGTNNDGVVIDLSSMKHVELINKAKQIVRIAGGARWGEVAAALQKHGLALSSGDTTSVGVGGLTLGGGIGWMVRKYGLAIDSLVGAEVVTAKGEILHASEVENPDLFWAIRGGGGNFGVVTQFEFAAHPIKQVYFGNIMLSLEGIGEALKKWRDYMRQASDDLTTSITLMPQFGEYPAGAMLLFCYATDDEAAVNAAIETLKNIGAVKNVDIHKKDYVDILEDAHPPAGVKAVVKNLFAENFSDELIDSIAAAAGKSSVMQIRYLGGAFARVTPEATAFYFRNSEIMMFSGTFVAMDATDEDIETAMQPWVKIAAGGKGAYANFISTTTEEDIAAVYPKATYQRLAKIKAIYDPANLFSQNYNIKPADA